MLDLEHLLRLHLADWQSGWSMGTFGAIAEFHQDEGEVPVIEDSYGLTRATRRGAIRIERRKLAEVRAVAYETLSPKRHRWSQGVALCLPERRARREARSVLTELGPDDGAIRGIDRTGILFDMGLSLPQCDFCIRTSDPKLLHELRANLGRSLFEHDNTAMPTIDCSPRNRFRHVLAFALRLRPGFQYPTFGWIDLRVRQCSVVGVFHQDETGSVVRIILLPKLDEQIEQPVRCLGLLLQDVGAEPENETECCKGMPQPKILGITIRFLDPVGRVLTVGGVHALGRNKQFWASCPVGDDYIDLLEIIFSKDSCRR
jgi:hypothetical protein